MANDKGTTKWIPKIVIEELKDIKFEEDIMKDSEAFYKLVKYARVGREANRLYNLDWFKPRKKY